MNSLENGARLIPQFYLLLVVIIVQITLLVLIATLVSRYCHVTAKCQHRIWVWVMVLMLGILPSYLMLPSWLSASIAVPSAEEVIESETIETTSGAPDIDTHFVEGHRRMRASGMIDRQLDRAKGSRDLPTEVIGENEQRHGVAPGIQEEALHDEVAAIPIDNAVSTIGQVEGRASPGDAVNAQDVNQKPSSSRHRSILTLVLGIYLLVCSYLVSRILLGWRRLNQIRRFGRSLDRTSLAIAQDVLEVVQLKTAPKMVSSSSVTTPMSWGILSPTVFLPASFSTWPTECQRAVFLHELSHIARHDAYSDLIARVCTTVYWFHPAVHLAARSLVNSREEAVDDRVIACGFSPVCYARQLVDVAERCLLIGDPNPLTATPMATRSSIESRVQRILQFTDHHRDVWPKWQSSLFLISLASLLLFLIPLRLIPVTSQTLIAQDHPQNIAAITLYERVQSMPLAATSEEAVTITIEGRVRKKDFTPAQAIVFCLQIQGSTAQLIGRSVTDEQGRYSLSIAATDSLRNKQLSLYAVDALNRLGWESRLNISDLQSDKLINIPLLLNESTGSANGELLAPGGKPMSGIKIVASEVCSPTDLSNSCRVDIAPFEFNAVSNENGQFSISDLPTNMLVRTSVDSDVWDCLRTVIIGTSGDMPDTGQKLASIWQYFEVSASIKLFPRVKLHGMVVDRKGTPVADAWVRSLPETTTDGNGKFSIQRFDPNAWGMDELKSYRETFEVEPPTDSRFVKTRFTLDHEQLSSREIKPVVLEGAWVSGRVLSAHTKQPLEGIQVRAEANQNVLATSDANGMFRFAMRPGQHSLRLAPRWMTSQERRQYQEEPLSRAVRPIDVLDDEPLNLGVILLDIETEAIKPLRIRVATSDGRPVESCLVALSHFRLSASGSIRETGPMSLVKGNSIEQYLLTDREGIATVKPAMGWVAPEPIEAASQSRSQPSDTNVVAVAYPSKSPRFFARLEITKVIPSSIVDVPLTEGAQYSGRVLLNGTPLAGVTIQLDARQPIDSNPKILPAELLQAETNEQGEYALYAPAWNSYAIKELQNFPTRGLTTQLYLPPPVATKDPTQFVFADIEFVYGSRSISGTVIDGEGKPIQGATIAYKRGSEIIANQSSTITNDDGKFLFNNLPDGSLSLVVRTRANGQTEVQVLDQQTDVRIVVSR